MYTIYCIEQDDPIVQSALDALMNDHQAILPHTNGNFVLVTDNSVNISGDGNPDVNIAVIVGHGSPNGISGQATFNLFNNQLKDGHRINGPHAMWVASCGTAGNGSLFAYGNFAQSTKDNLRDTIVWASSTNVDAHTFEGDWRQMQ